MNMDCTQKKWLAKVAYGVMLLTASLSWQANAEQTLQVVPPLLQTVAIKARTDKDFMLSADYYFGGKRDGGVIVLHDCQSDRQAYKNIAKTLSEQGLHTLLVDFRGYGASVATGYSRKDIKKSAINIVDYQSGMALLTTYWQEDLLAAYQFLRTKIEPNKGIAIVASGCAGTYAVALAEKIYINSMVLITPSMAYSDKERYKNLIDIPSYFIISTRHQESYQTAQELFTWNGASQSKMQIFKGDRYASQLIARRKLLIDDIAHWIKLTINK